MVTTAGAETLPYLASLVVLPASLAFFMLYGKLVEALPSVRRLPSLLSLQLLEFFLPWVP